MQKTSKLSLFCQKKPLHHVIVIQQRQQTFSSKLVGIGCSRPSHFLRSLGFLYSSESVLIKTKTQSNPGPGCPKTCGGITIQFPFGTEENCYLDRSYMVNCSTTSGRARIQAMNVDVVDISSDGHLRVLSPVARVCYNHTDVVSSFDPSVRLSRFPISLGKNRITALGCDTRGNIKIGKEYLAGCPKMPGSCNAVVGSCSSTIGCCQSTIEPAQLTKFWFHVESNQGNVGKKGFNNCSYAFIVEVGRYNFSSINIYNLQMKNLEPYQMVLDWTVGNTSCQEARNDQNSYLCKENSECYNATNGPGYRCSCSGGYQGNPYLRDGCQDINECDDHRLNDCTHLCKNTAGCYTCLCPKGHSGNGRRAGTRCIRNQTNLQKLGLYVGVSMGAIVTSLTMVFLYCLSKQRRNARRREKIFRKNGGMIFEKILSECDESTQMVKIFTEKELKKATNNFNQNNVVGQGGFGTVYKGVLPDYTVVAIKKSKLIDPSQIEQFVNEVVLVSQINHPKIVKLVGCCLETHVPLLAYEYIINEAVHHHLHGNGRGSSLTWRMRLSIAAETAEALAYMHSATQIIHRDIKSSNILLNDDYTVKVSDFGISRSVPMDKTHISTAVQGTLGYIDPEYFCSGILTDKSDVYSFGELVVELLTGEKVNSFVKADGNRSLVTHFVSSLDEDCLIQVLDDQVKKDATSEQLNRVAELAKSCLELEGKKRPTMKQVKEELEELQKSFCSPYVIQESISIENT